MLSNEASTGLSVKNSQVLVQMLSSCTFLWPWVLNSVNEMWTCTDRDVEPLEELGAQALHGMKKDFFATPQPAP